MRLIDADALIKKTSHLLFFDVNDKIVFDTFIENAPTVDIKTEVAREIFEEIFTNCVDYCGYIEQPKLAELKNKYTKEGVGNESL